MVCEDPLGVVLGFVSDPRHLVVFAGAGLSVPSPSNYPTWSRAALHAAELAKKNGLDRDFEPTVRHYLDQEEYYRFFRVLKEELSETAYVTLLHTVFPFQGRYNKVHEALVALPLRGVITTNFDNLVETAFTARKRQGMPRLASYYEQEKLQHIVSRMGRDFFVVKAHGDLQSPGHMVLTPEQCTDVARSKGMETLFASVGQQSQLLFLGYSMRDPDFWALWDVLRQTVAFAYPVVACFPHSEVDHKRVSELRNHNIQVVSFDNTDGSYAFVRDTLVSLRKPAKRERKLAGSNGDGERIRREEYVYLYGQFLQEREDRFMELVCALCVAELSEASKAGAVVTKTALRRAVIGDLQLGLLGTEQMIGAALQSLRRRGLVEVTGDCIKLADDVQAILENGVRQLEEAEATILESILQEVGGQPASREQLIQFKDAVDGLLLEYGRELAEQVVFGRPPNPDLRKAVEKIAARKVRGRVAKELMRSALCRLVLDMKDREAEWFASKLHAYALTSAYILHPKSEKLVKEFVSRHVLYLDSSIALPALAVGHSLHAAYLELLNRSRLLGARLVISPGMLGEVAAHLRKAVAQFGELESGDIETNLRAYVLCTGEAQGNVFVEGYLGERQRNPRITWRAYLFEVAGATQGGREDDREAVGGTLSSRLGVEALELTEDPLGRDEVERLTGKLLELRARRRRDDATGRMLSRHEATLFYHIHRMRSDTPTQTFAVWLLTTDVHLSRLQRVEHERYPLPVVYYPAAWSQYLDLLDYRARGRGNFAKLMKRVEYGMFTGDTASKVIHTVATMLVPHGMEDRVEEFMKRVITDYHIRRLFDDVRQEESAGFVETGAKADQLQEVVRDFVIAQRGDIDSLSRRLDEQQKQSKERERKHEAEIAKLRSQVAAKRHHISVLKSMLKDRRQNRP